MCGCVHVDVCGCVWMCVCVCVFVCLCVRVRVRARARVYRYMPMCEELGYIPTEKYAHQPELLAHSQMIAKKYVALIKH